MIQQVSVAVLALTLTGTAQAQSRNVLTGPAPAWVLAAPQQTSEPAPADAAFRFIYSDTQIMMLSDGQSEYVAYRIKVLKPEALAIGNISLVWSPEDGDATVHALRIWRGGTAINVLKTTKFSVLQREGGLEAAALDGLLTAALQTPGLQIGDELEFAATVRRRDAVLGPNGFGTAQLPVAGLNGPFRIGLSWPVNGSLATRATRDLPPAIPVVANGLKTVTVEVRDPTGSIATDGAPARFNIRRQIEYSTFASWDAVSRLFYPLYEQAATIGPASPLRAEIARIKAANVDPAARAIAALRLVQDQVRYVYVGLNGGNYRPAGADETWQRRFGDCKAKTALLLGLLRALDIPAEAVVVNPLADDGIDQHLPSPGVFNHILVRAQISGKPYWFDGTRLGDRYLDRLPAPPFYWALPIAAKDAKLEAVPSRETIRPMYVAVIDIDATAGFKTPAKVKATQVLRDDEAFVIRSQLAAMSTADADRALRGYWAKEQDWVDPDSVAWHYDERTTTLVMALTGTGPIKWDGNDSDGRNMTLIAGGFFPPDTLKRPKEQDQTAPWTVDFPRYRCWATTLRLPVSAPKFGWRLYADPMNAEIGGARYFRASSLTENVVRMVKSRKALTSEITAEMATANNAAITTFNNNMSSVDQTSPGIARKSPASARVAPYGDDTDWTGDAPACGPASR